MSNFIQDTLDIYKSFIDEIFEIEFINKDIDVNAKELPAEDGSYIAYSYGIWVGKKYRIGIIGYDFEEKVFQFVVEWTEMTDRNVMEGVGEEKSDTWLVFNDPRSFVNWFLGKYKISHLEKKKGSSENDNG